MKNIEYNALLKKLLTEVVLLEYRETLLKSNEVSYSDLYQKNIRRIFNGDDLENSIMKNCRKLEILRYTACFAALILFLTASVLVFNVPARNCVVSAIQKIIQYVESEDLYLVADGNEKIFTLSGSVRMEYSDGYIKINSAYTKNEKMYVTLEGTTRENAFESDNVYISDDSNTYKMSEINYLRDDDTGVWSCLAVFDINIPQSVYTLNIDSRVLPIVLQEAESVNQDNVNFYEDRELNYNLAIVTSYNEDKLMLTVLSDVGDSDIEVAVPYHEIYILNSDNEKIFPVNDMIEGNTVGFDCVYEDDMYVVIPYVTLSEYGTDERATITVEKDLPLETEIQMNQKNILLQKTDWLSYYQEMNLRLPDGSRADEGAQAQEISFFAKLDEKTAGNMKLVDLNFNIDDKYLNQYSASGVNLIWNDPYEKDNAEGEFTIKNIRADIEKVEIEISEPVYKTMKPISILLRT